MGTHILVRSCCYAVVVVVLCVCCHQSIFGFGPSATVAIKFDDTEGRETRTVETVDGSSTEDLYVAPPHLPTKQSTAKQDLTRRLRPHTRAVFANWLWLVVCRYIYQGSEHVKGTVTVTVPPGKKLEHIGIKVELLGQIGTCVFVAAQKTSCCSLALAHRHTHTHTYAELYYDRGNHHDVVTEVALVATPGVIDGTTVRGHTSSPNVQSICLTHLTAPFQQYKFDFGDKEKPYETYNGINVRCRYDLRCNTIT